METDSDADSSISDMNFSWLADQVVPFLGRGAFLFCARISKDFRNTYLHNEKDTATSLQAVVEETNSRFPSRRLQDVIECLKSLPRSAGKPPLQHLRWKGKEEASLIPPAALLVLILARAVKTRNALPFTETLAKFFGLPPAFLLLAHLDAENVNSILHVVQTFVHHGLMEEVIDLRGMVDSIGLSLDTVLPPSARGVLQLSVCVWEGNVDGFRACLTEWVKDLREEHLVLLHELIHRRRPSMKKTTGESEVTRKLGETLLTACVTSGRTEEGGVWHWFVYHWPDVEASRLMLPLYIYRLSKHVAEKVRSGRAATGEVLGELRRFVIWFNALWDSSRFLSASEADAERLFDALKVFFHEIALLIRNFRERGWMSNIRPFLDEVFSFLLHTQSLALLQAFIPSVGEDFFFRLLEMSKEDWRAVGSYRSRVGCYWGWQHLAGCRFLRAMRPEWRLVLPSRDVHMRRNKVTLKEWGEVEFFIFECGLSWAEVLRDADLQTPLHEQAAAAGAPRELLRYPREHRAKFVSLPPPNLSWSAETVGHCENFVSLSVQGVSHFRSGVRQFVNQGSGGGVPQCPPARLHASLKLNDFARFRTKKGTDLFEQQVLMEVCKAQESSATSRTQRMRSCCNPALIVPALAHPLAVGRHLGFLITVGLLHLCSCLTIPRDEIAELKTVASISLLDVANRIHEQSRNSPGFIPGFELNRARQALREGLSEYLGDYRWLWEFMPPPEIVEETQRRLKQNIEIFHKGLVCNIFNSRQL
uniref:Uncharacterized protein n=1 Tax=Chromera velia CCMP2878 TaxID=1169474 RepID=A0A0G4HEM2_9ALVE|eukprot:Cvel_26816.t1-p1 / transcript=Cvel_26816.t1 / gene=Cvel_26816 / organism=Chromera_velia_CCMP2878 / gene_product=hypothetical protein / transcript_product=hypothetical protein / location=Cvel_scaffold3248:5564-7843(-) / protein_length=760 / sequence_SO=supercontig / SO=protein_coding / is_pseudo=false